MTWRKKLETFIDSDPVQHIVMGVIILNAVTIGLETAIRHGEPYYNILHALDLFALAVFVIELVIKLVAYGPKKFFTGGWNVFDFLVVAIALVPGSGPLAVLRTLRILRVLRLIKFFPQLRMVVEALMHALPGIGAIGILMLMIYYVSAVMATMLFGTQFPEWFGDLGKSAYTLFQVMTLESWSMGIVRPVMEAQPYAWIFFIPFILLSAFTMLNLFIAVIVDTMQTVRSSAAESEEDEVSAVSTAAGQAAAEMDSQQVLAELAAQVAAIRTELHQLHRDAPLPPRH